MCSAFAKVVEGIGVESALWVAGSRKVTKGGIVSVEEGVRENEKENEMECINDV